LSPDGTTIASIEDESPIVILRNLSTGKEVRRFVDNSSFVNSIAFSPNGKLFWGAFTGLGMDPMTLRNVRKY